MLPKFPYRLTNFAINTLICFGIWGFLYLIVLVFM